MGKTVVEQLLLGHTLPVRNRVESQMHGLGYAVQLNQAHWHDGGEDGFINLTGVIEFVIQSSIDMQVDACGDFRPLAGVSFFPEGSKVRGRWKQGSSRSLTCALDLDRLLRLAYAEPDIQDEPMTAALNLQAPTITVAMRRVINELQFPSFASELQVQCLLMTVAIDLKRAQTGRALAATPEKGKLTPIQLQALRDLVHGADETPTLEQMARACRVHPRYLSTLFRNSCNGTLRSYVAAGRIERAQTLLLGKDVLIKQVAHASGFRSAAAFTAAFRKATGLTPAQFRDTGSLARA